MDEKTTEQSGEKCGEILIELAGSLTKLVSLKRFFVKPLRHGVEHFVCVDDVVCREKDVFFL